MEVTALMEYSVNQYSSRKKAIANQLARGSVDCTIWLIVVHTLRFSKLLSTSIIAFAVFFF